MVKVSDKFKGIVILFGKIPKPYRKYVYTFIIFLLMLVFFLENNMFTHFSNNKKLKVLEEKKEYYIDKIKEDSVKLRNYENDTSLIEKDARELYLMKRDDEDLFILVEDSLETEE